MIYHGNKKIETKQKLFFFNPKRIKIAEYFCFNLTDCSTIIKYGTSTRIIIIITTNRPVIMTTITMTMMMRVKTR